MKNMLIPLLIAGTTLVVGCEPKQPAVKREDAIASVNNRYIPKATLENLQNELAARGQDQAFPKEKIIEELIQREILVQEALRKQLDRSPEVLQRLEETKKTLLTQAFIQDFIKNNPVTEDEIKAEYDKQVGGANATEFKARHILVKTEDEAKKIIALLDKGGDFAKLANQHSLDGKETKSGGDLGWFSPNQMVEPFSNAVIALQDGKYTRTPVQTQFGWHVILREGSRPQTPPPLEAVREQISQYLQRKKIEDMLKEKREQAKVEILVPLTADKPAADAQPASPEAAAEEAPAEAGGQAPATPEAAPAGEPKEPAKPAADKKN